MALGLGRWTVERVGSRVREMADSVREMADNLPRTQMPAVRMPPWVRLPEVKMTPAPCRGVHPLWVVAGAAGRGRAPACLVCAGGGAGENAVAGGGGEGPLGAGWGRKGEGAGAPPPPPCSRRARRGGGPPAVTCGAWPAPIPA